MTHPDSVEGLVLINMDPETRGWMDWAAQKVTVHLICLKIFILKSFVLNIIITQKPRRFFCIYYGSHLQLHFLGSSKIKAVFTILKTLHLIHSTLSVCLQATTHHIFTTQNPCMCIVRMLSCVCVYVCVASQYPLFHEVYFYLCFKSHFTAYISYLMWNRVSCSHGSI